MRRGLSPWPPRSAARAGVAGRATGPGGPLSPAAGVSRTASAVTHGPLRHGASTGIGDTGAVAGRRAAGPAGPPAFGPRIYRPVTCPEQPRQVIRATRPPPAPMPHRGRGGGEAAARRFHHGSGHPSRNGAPAGRARAPSMTAEPCSVHDGPTVNRHDRPSSHPCPFAVFHGSPRRLHGMDDELKPNRRAHILRAPGARSRYTTGYRELTRLRNPDRVCIDGAIRI